MILHDRRALKNAADRSLTAYPLDSRKIVLIYSGAAMALALLTTALDFLIQHYIEGTGGLSGIGMRSALSTVCTVLQIAQAIILPFWEMGYLYCTMKMARTEPQSPAMLLEGFRKWGPVLRWHLLRGVIFVALAIACYYVSMQIFIITPFAGNLVTLLEPYLEAIAAGSMPALDAATMSAIMKAYVPMLVIFAVLYLATAIPVSYTYRLSGYALLDVPKRGALVALRNSRKMMRGNRLALFKLDLSFWWYYVLQVLLALLAYGDVILSLLGVELPWSDNVSFFVFYVLFHICQLALFILVRNKVEVTYVHAYDTLHEPVQPEESAPRQQPWNY